MIRRIKESKALQVLGILIIGIFVLLISRVTYAYLAPSVDGAKSTNVGGSADLVDDFKFVFDGTLEVLATPTTLPENGDDYVTSTTATAKLKANSTNNIADYTYYLYLSITDNTFKYIEANKPEMLLTIIDPNGNIVTSLDNLTYTTYNGVSGFDITTSSGLFTIADNYSITSSSSTIYTEQEWMITIAYMNQDFDQSANFGNSVKTSLSFKKLGIPRVNEVALSSTPTSVTVTVDATASADAISKYYYSLNDGEYVESTSNTYTFSNLDSSTNYKVSCKVLNSDGNESSVLTNRIDTKEYVNPSITNVTSTTAWNQISVTVSSQAGTNAISKYYYSINNGTYQTSTSNTYTFSNLTASTSYTIKTKVVDTQGKESSERVDSITTSAYVLANITNLTTSVTASTITITPVITKGTGTVSKYYYSKDGGSSYTESTSSSYTFSGLTGGTTYSIKVYVKDSNSKSSSVYSKSVTTENNLLAAYIKSKYTGTQGDNGLYYHNSTLANGAGDNSYRYAGADPNNYVCFGSDATTCPDDNLYRIIGVFGDQVKLIKADYATSTQLGTDGAYNSSTFSASDYSNYKGSLTTINRYYWGSYWSYSDLNTINLNLNYITYLNNMNSKWTNMISTTTWQFGGNSYSKLYQTSAPNAYQNEIVSPAKSKTSDGKIGLMYVSDYGYAAESSAWTTSLYKYGFSDITAVDWMYTGINEWSITPRSDDSNYTCIINYNGNVGSLYGNNHVEAVRPCFYLNSTVTYTGIGDGQKDSPYRIA